MCQDCPHEVHSTEIASVSATQCTSCELGRPFFDNNNTGSSNSSACLCKETYFMDSSVEEAGLVRILVVGAPAKM